MNKRNKALIITGIILLVVALAVFLIGGWLAGWDFAAYFQSPAFAWVFVIFILYLISVIAIVLFEKIKNL